MERHLHLRPRAFTFLLVAVAILATATVLSTRIAWLDEPALVGVGMTLDLTVLLPVAFYFLVARPRAWSWLSAVPVAILAALLTRVLLPAEHRGALGMIELVLGAIELGILSTVFLKLRRVLKSGRSTASVDAYAQIREASKELFSSPLAAGALASELASLHYGLFSWKSKPHVPSGAKALGMYRRANHGPMVVALLVLSLAEGIAAHLLLGLWSPLAAWCSTLLGAYGAFWLIADYRATVLNPSLVTDDTLQLRAGLRWRGLLQRSQCLEWTRKRPTEFGKPISFVLLGEPTHWIVLREEVEFDGPLGIRKRARLIGVTPDDRATLEEFVGNGGTETSD